MPFSTDAPYFGCVEGRRSGSYSKFAFGFCHGCSPCQTNVGTKTTKRKGHNTPLHARLQMRTPRRLFPRYRNQNASPNNPPGPAKRAKRPPPPRLGSRGTVSQKAFFHPLGISPGRTGKRSASLGNNHAGLATLASLARPQRPRNPALGDEPGTRHFLHCFLLPGAGHRGLATVIVRMLAPGNQRLG